ncbi:calcium-translocating P-type ATPase, PMCA-type [Fusobacterium sp.]|uniref:calcium-translocating P-type ATPase, PMCA-type n=1 Tax=Fusobacterium sp. TaxID=68766 RepID=UPI00262BBD94|nr:calcium-translocating P-type ATPase, PMCA-type [Fusobacterium sp.]
MKKFFNQSTKELFDEFGITEEGLSSAQVKENMEKYGLNQLEEGEKESAFSIFISQFKDVLVIILIIAGFISMFTGNFESSIVIFVVITMNAILGTVQHIRAESSLESLKNLSSPKTRVIRDGEKMEISSKNVVVGDIIHLEAGDIVPADARIIECFSLKANESSLTGESESIEKTDEIIDKTDLPLGDQKNMIFSGSLVTYGRGTAVVVKTGMNTEIGKIATLMKETKENLTPLQISLDNFGRNLSISILVLCAFVFGTNIFHGLTVVESLLFAVALAVAAIPEALNPIVTIVLAIGTQKMSKENAIIKKLKAVEGLGSVSIICSDKTGTLTQNKMTVKKIYIDEKVINSEDIDLNNNLQGSLIKFSCLCSDAISSNGSEIGDPTETALTNLANKLGMKETEIRNNHKRLAEIPFDSDRKLMSVLCDVDNRNLMITKGALDVILRRTKYILTSEGIRKINSSDIKNIENTNFEMSNNGLRVLAFVVKEANKLTQLNYEDENDFIFVGLISMIDPPRPESKQAVADCIKAGIKPIMITGDHKITASAIAREIGILRDGDRALEGIELEKLSDEEFEKEIEHISVYARVSPSDKIRIVSMWQKKGNICAMTGDGVNDAPALKKADIGIAMGITGTEVSKDAASMILTDDNFSTIIKAVATGRNIYANIKNSIKFLLSGNLAGIISVFYASILNLPMPFAPVHLLFINLVTDSLPAIAIGMEPGSNKVLEEKPRDINEPILTKELSTKILLEGLLITIFVLIGFYKGLEISKELGMTMAFSILCLARLFHGFNCRSNSSIIKLGLRSNIFSVFAFIIGTFLLTLILLVPAFGKFFETAPINLEQLGMIYLLAFVPTLIIQIIKFIRYDLKK